MPSLKRYRLFISHAWKYNQPYYRLINYLNGAANFSYINYSVPEHDPKEGDIEEALKRQLRPVQVVIILGGIYVSYRQWIQFEIDFAKCLNKPILGVKPWGAKVMPKTQDAADEIVGWNTLSIVNAIRRLASL